MRSLGKKHVDPVSQTKLGARKIKKKKKVLTDLNMILMSNLSTRSDVMGRWCRLQLKREHETKAAAHKKLTLDDRACNRFGVWMHKTLT